MKSLISVCFHLKKKSLKECGCMKILAFYVLIICYKLMLEKKNTCSITFPLSPRSCKSWQLFASSETVIKSGNNDTVPNVHQQKWIMSLYWIWDIMCKAIVSAVEMNQTSLGSQACEFFKHNYKLGSHLTTGFTNVQILLDKRRLKYSISSYVLYCFKNMDMLKPYSVLQAETSWQKVAKELNESLFCSLYVLVWQTLEINLCVGFKWGSSFLGSVIFIKFLICFFPPSPSFLCLHKMFEKALGH